MPWKETCAMDERMRFVIAASAEGAVLTAVCAAFGISRTTGYTWLSRYRAAGPAGLVDRSRAPHCHGRARPEALVEAALALRGRYPTWGPRKLRVKLAELWPQEPLPAASTLGDWLRDAGLTRAPRRRRSSAPFTQPLSGAAAPNDVWTIDFKGWFRTGDGRRCDPLTVQDAASRYLLDCRGLDKPDHAHVRPCLEALFGAYGLPRAIRSDNGPPFASLAAGGLSALALWWLQAPLDALPRSLALLVLIAAGGTGYLALAQLTGGATLGEVRTLLARRPS